LEQSHLTLRTKIAAELHSEIAPEVDQVIFSLDQIIGSPGLSAAARSALRKISRKQCEISTRIRSEILRLNGESENFLQKVEAIRLIHPLTERELEVLKQIESGKSAKKIAEILFLSEATVKSHTGALYRKLGVNSRVAAINTARIAGILKPE
jgi:DNA-binding NarL/FixJ family response regulator